MRIIAILLLCICSFISAVGQDKVSRKQNTTKTTQNDTKNKGATREKNKTANSTTYTPSSPAPSILLVQGSTNPSSIWLKSSGEKDMFIRVSGVKDSYDYSISTPSWVSYFSKTATGFRIRCNENTSEYTRDGYIIVSCSTQQVQLKVAQTSNYKPLKVNGKDQDAYTFSSSGEGKVFTISGGLENYTVTVPYWISYRKDGQKLTLGCDKNPYENRRSAWVTISDGKTTAKIAAVQNGSSFYKSPENVNSQYYQQNYSSKKTYKSRPDKFYSWTQHDNSFYIFAQGGGGLVDGQFAPAAGGGFGFNIKWFNMEGDYLGLFESGSSSLAGSISLGYNIFSDRRYQLTPQAGFGFFMASGDGYMGGAVALRWDIGLCHHLNFFIKPKVILTSYVIPSINGGLSVYF